MPAAAVASSALEFTQIWFGRTVSRNDIVAETLGAVNGAVLWLGVGPHVVAWLRTFHVDRRPRAHFEWLVQAYVLGFVIWSIIPLDLTISLTELYHKFKRGQVLLVPFSYSYDSPSTMMYQLFGDTVVFVPVGAWAALSQRQRVPVRSPLLAAIFVGGFVARVIGIVRGVYIVVVSGVGVIPCGFVRPVARVEGIARAECLGRPGGLLGFAHAVLVFLHHRW